MIQPKKKKDKCKLIYVRYYQFMNKHSCANNLWVPIWKTLRIDDGADRSSGLARARDLTKTPACPCILAGRVLLHFLEM